MKDVQGSRANKAGKKLEDMVRAEFVKHGVYSLPYRHWVVNEAVGAKGTLVMNVPYTTIYNHRGRSEFVLMRNGFSDVRIECRSQNVAGSVDEKLPYLFDNAVACEERTVLLVIEGDGFKKGAKGWLADQATAIKHKNIYVVSFVEFQNWVNRNLGTVKIKTKKIYQERKIKGVPYHEKVIERNG